MNNMKFTEAQQEQIFVSSFLIKKLDIYER